MPKDKGGSAFPNNSTTGITLRDYFAGQALAGFLESARQRWSMTFSTCWLQEWLTNFIADAMIAERNKGEQDDA